MFFQCECRTLASSFTKTKYAAGLFYASQHHTSLLGLQPSFLGAEGLRGRPHEGPMLRGRSIEDFFVLWALGTRRGSVVFCASVTYPNYPVPVSLSYTTLTSHLLNYILPVSYIKTISIEIKYIYYFLLCFNAKKMTRTCNLTSTTVREAYEPLGHYEPLNLTSLIILVHQEAFCLGGHIWVPL